MSATVDGDRLQSLNVAHDLPSYSGSVPKSHSGTEQTSPEGSEQVNSVTYIQCTNIGICNDNKHNKKLQINN